MGLFAKVKDILFEEEEVTEPVKKTKEEKKEVKKEISKEDDKPVSRQIQPEKKEKEEEKEIVTPPPKRIDGVSERELFRSENRSPFLDFDEEEFDNSVSRTAKPKQTTNILEYERKKRTEKRTDYGRIEKTEVREIVEKKKFRPSPIISPVYGVLNEDYKPEDIKEKKDPYNDSLDIDSVRRKAFEPQEKELPDETYYEKTVTVKIKEPEETKAQKVKTIDELLEDSSDMEIDLRREDKNTRQTRNTEYSELEDELDQMMAEEEVKQPPKRAVIEEDDDQTLENDLFDLIDSMYDSREEDDY